MTRTPPPEREPGPLASPSPGAAHTSGERAEGRERWIHRLFLVSLILKGLHAVVELASGVFLQLVSTAALAEFLMRISRGELREDPGDLIANYLYHTGQTLSAGGREFGALYLLTHGAVNMGLVVGLLREKLWAYPVALAALGGFAGYQVYRYTQTHALALVGLTVLDLIVVLLVWHEYRIMRGRLGRRGT